MTTGDLFSRVLGALEQAEIPVMLTGSFASSFHGAPRATQDVDLVISPTTEQLRRLLTVLPKDEFYFDEGAAREALRLEGQFNLVDLRTGWKVDLIIRKSRPFSREEFDRRTVVEVEGALVPIASPEDVLIAKMEWARMSESARQLEDAATLLRVRAGQIDYGYVERWVGQLGLKEQWTTVKRIASG